jgi:hypothetical protein
MRIVQAFQRLTERTYHYFQLLILKAYKSLTLMVGTDLCELQSVMINGKKIVFKVAPPSSQFQIVSSGRQFELYHAV